MYEGGLPLLRILGAMVSGLFFPLLHWDSSTPKKNRLSAFFIGLSTALSWWLLAKWDIGLEDVKFLVEII
jgi:hypothetical protein